VNDTSPSDEEVVAAFVVAQLLRPVVVVEDSVEAARVAAWRFSGRWWARPVAARRERPWY
jgi:hypothetical protein